MASKTQIANLSLTRIGASKQVANVETERSTEARAINLIFDDERDYVLRDFPWPFATSYVALGLVSGSETERTNSDWQYAYRFPSDCLFVRRIVTANGRKEKNPPPFSIGRDSQGRLVYTDEADAEIEYTVQVTDPAEFDPIFVSALAWRIGMTIAGPLSRIEGIVKTCAGGYQYDKDRAEVQALNESQPEQPSDAEWIRGRE